MADGYRILTLNQISSQGLHRFPAARYTVGKAIDDPDAILVRSQDMHALAIPPSVRAIGRAGAVNAALLAASILGNKYPHISDALKTHRAKQTQDVLDRPDPRP